MSPLPAAIAEVRADRQLEIRNPDRRLRWTTATAGQIAWASWHSAGAEDNRAMHSWPTWCPDGSAIACFRTPARGLGPELVVISSDGIRTNVLRQFDDELPIYVQWAPDGRRLAVLFQQADRLGLWVTKTDGSSAIELGRGSPLFFTWADAEHIAAFHGRPNGPRVGLFDVRDGNFHSFPGTPGNFCAPVRLAGRIAYVANHDGRLCAWLADHSAARELEPIEGLAALLPSPDGTVLARALAPDERSSYRDLVLLDPLTGNKEALDDGPLTAFLWAQTGDQLVIARTDERSGVVAFSRLELATGIDIHLGDLRPTRDLRFYLRFFEQFAQSHPLIDPAGQSLVVPGELDRAGGAEGLWRLPLDGSAPDRLGDGLLGVWGPTG